MTSFVKISSLVFYVVISLCMSSNVNGECIGFRIDHTHNGWPSKTAFISSGIWIAAFL